MKNSLIEKIQRKEAVIGVVGLGYVGLPLIKRLNEVGLKTLGLDIDESKVEALQQGRKYIKHIDVDDIFSAINTGFSEVTTDFSAVTTADVIILCVPTPLNKYREPDLSFVTGSLETLLPHLKPGQMLSLESTTYPGTTEEELLPRIQSKGLKIGDDFFLVYSPEREDPGNPDFNTHTIPKVCGGTTEACLEVGRVFYSQIIEQVVPVSSTKAAEMTKILENTYRAVNIALVNELKVVADKMGIDIFEVIDAAATKPFGYKAFYPGPGLGGHCIPIDPFYLTWKAREFGLHTRFIELAGEVNTSMPSYVISKIVDGLNDQAMSVKGSKILVMGAAYKKNVDDMRESPSVEIMESLIALGAQVDYFDPYVPSLPKMRNHDLDLDSVDFNENTIQAFDCVLIATDHDNVDYSLLDNATLVVDSRGLISADAPNLVRA
ncbi:UDP-N-acetyl-D-glucosamine 6-dehydrogenase [Arenicella sp. 4NH20-0111]|uniref:nucleotide sugar dehydrogenase n=1 Tax=Arenicella sp. 4NH20-0111 TaxID=3127648 RepID=UPI00310552CA